MDFTYRFAHTAELAIKLHLRRNTHFNLKSGSTATEKQSLNLHNRGKA
jgi:hypothetical protein